MEICRPGKKILYLDVDGVLQYADNGCWRPRLEAQEFLEWTVRNFECRWLTSWPRPNEMIPIKLAIRVPPGILEVNWYSPSQKYSFKASAIRDEEDWLWLEDSPSDFDLSDLRKRGQLSRLIIVDPNKAFLLLGTVRDLLEARLRGG